jgi:hypothetical protein
MNTETLKKFAPFVAAILVIAGLGYTKYSGYFDKVSQTETSKPSIVERVTGAKLVASFVPPQEILPVGGKLKSIVELGASGFNAFIVRIDSQGRYAVKTKKFGSSLAIEGNTSLDEVKKQLRAYIAEMSNDVGGKDLHFVISSGALMEPKVQNIARGLKELGYVVNQVTASQEGNYAFMAAMHPDYADRAFVVDIGSGNTKISWLTSNGVKTLEAAGAKYFQKGTDHDTVFADVQAKASQIPQNQRELCFLIGGGPNDLAKQGQNVGRYYPLAELSSYNLKDQKAECTVNILKAIQTTTGTKYVFDDNAFFPVGLLISLK